MVSSGGRDSVCNQHCGEAWSYSTALFEAKGGVEVVWAKDVLSRYGGTSRKMGRAGKR
jgi:hypothetical protein